MAAPTVLSITPAIGQASGDVLVTIAGANFRTATVPSSPAQPNAEARETVRVLFDGVPGVGVEVFSSTELTVRTPRTRPRDDAGAIAVTIANVGEDGEIIDSESVAIPGAFTFVRPKHTAEFSSDLSFVIRTLMRVLKAQLVVKEVNFAVATDYDEDTGDSLSITKFAELPSLALAGPSMTENRAYSENEEPEFDDVDDGFVQTRVPYTVDLTFTIVGASDNKMELLNMMSNFVAFMHANKRLAVDRDSTSPSKGFVEYEMDFVTGSQPKYQGTVRNSNLHTFSTDIVVRGFMVEGFSGVNAGTRAGVPNAAIVKRGRTAESVNVDPPSPK